MDNKLYARIDITITGSTGMLITRHYGITNLTYASDNRVSYIDRRGTEWEISAPNIAVSKYKNTATAPKMGEDFPYMDTEPVEENPPES